VTGHELCAVYLAVKLHFTSDSYDFTKGSGKTKIGVEAFQKRKDKYKFHKLAKMLPDDEVVPFLVANFVENDTAWSQDLISDNAEEVYSNWQKVIQSLAYTFENDFVKLLDTDSENAIYKHKVINSKFEAKNGDHPEALSLYMQGEITIETMVILNVLINYLNRWDKEITDTVVYPKIAKKIRKYQSFLAVDVDKMKSIVKKHLTVQ
jgi:hypothetical protein